jgi:hypothetical protein
MRSRVLATGILAAIVLGLIGARLGPASAHEPHPGLNFYIAVHGVPNCDTKSGDGSCDLLPGTVFVIDVYLDPLPSDIPSYEGFDIGLSYSGVTAQQDASTDAWPECGFPAKSYDTPNVVNFACAMGLPPAGPSTYSGLIGTNSFTCDQSGSIATVHGSGSGKTDLIENVNTLAHSEDPNTTETLTINCVANGITPIPNTPRPGSTSAAPSTLPPTGQAKATATAKATAPANGTPGPIQVAGGGGGGGLSAGVIAIIVIAAVVVAGGAGFFGWRYLQSRRGAGGGT